MILLVWLALPALLMSYVSRPVHPFYLLLTLPAGHILAAHGVDLLMRWPPRWTAAVALAAGGILIAAVGGLNVWRYAEETLALPGAHGLTALPLGAGMDMADRLLSAPDSAEDAVIADVEDWILNSFAGRLFAVNRDTDTDHTSIIPEGGGRYLLFSAPGESPRPPRDPVDEVRHSFDDGSAVVRYSVDARSAEGCIGEHTALPSDVGLSFLGYRLESRLAAGAAAILCTAWRVDELSTERFDWLYAPYVHIFDATGARVAIGDGSSTPGASWRLGDVQLKMISVTLPGGAEGPFTLRFGLYDGVHSRGASFSLPGGKAAPDIPGEVLRAAP